MTRSTLRPFARPRLESLEGRDLLAAGCYDVASAFADSAERSANFVDAAYQTYLLRPADPVGLSGWVDRMADGFTEEELEAGLLASGEYFNLQGGTDADWIAGLYADVLGRGLSTPELAFWLGQLDAGANPFDVALGFTASDEREALVVTNYYVNFLDRFPTEDEVVHWLGVLDDGFTRQDVAASLTSDVEYFELNGNATTTWVAGLYADLLGRTATDDEVGAWFGVVVEKTYAAAAPIANSTEGLVNVVADAYSYYLRRGPDDAGLAFWVDLLEDDWTEAEVEAALASSAEYIALWGGTDADWITGLYSDVLGRGLSDVELDYWLGQLDAGANPFDVALGFTSSDEREVLVVTGYYDTYLGRLPTEDEVVHWLGVLDDGFTRRDVVASLVSDAEYYAATSNNNDDWVAAVYNDLLFRTPSEADVAYWTGVIC
jgi:hypothetical protein